MCPWLLLNYVINVSLYLTDCFILSVISAITDQFFYLQKISVCCNKLMLLVDLFATLWLFLFLFNISYSSFPSLLTTLFSFTSILSMKYHYSPFSIVCMWFQIGLVAQMWQYKLDNNGPSMHFSPRNPKDILISSHIFMVRGKELRVVSKNNPVFIVLIVQGLCDQSGLSARSAWLL